MGTRGLPFAIGRRFKHLQFKPAGPQPEGRPREEITAPISPTGALSDTVAYEKADEPATRLHVPRLRLRTDAASYDIRISSDGGRWSIRFGIEAFPAEELGDDARTAALPFTLPSATLTYRAPPLDKQLPASEIIPDAGGWTVGFGVDLAGKDEVLWALASEHGIKLVVQRSFTAAVPVVTTPPEPRGHIKVVDDKLLLRPVVVAPVEPEPPPDPDDQLAPTVIQPGIVFQPLQPFGAGTSGPFGVRVRDHRAGAGGAAARVRDHRSGVAGIPATLFGRGLELPFTGLEAGDAKPIGPKKRLEMLDKFRDIAFDPGRVVVVRPKGDSPGVDLPDEIRYRETPVVLPAEIALRLEPAAHPAIFSGGTTAPHFTTVRVIHPPGASGRSHVYFHDENRPGTFHFLPDEYCLDRTDTPPLRPAVVFRVDQGDDEAAARTALTFRLTPRVDHNRLDAAAAELGKLLPPPREGEPPTDVVLVPVQTEAELNLGLPAGAVLEAPPLDLVNGFVAQVFFPFDEFQDVFAALASTQELGTLLRGNVDVTVGQDEGPTSGHALIPVDLRFGSATSDVLTAEDSRVAGGAVALTLRNSSESPVRIDALPLRVARGGAEVAATASGLVLPLELAAGAETSFEVTPSEPLPGEGDADVLVDLTAVVPLPDPEAILALTLDQQIAQLSEREVTVVIARTRLAGEDPVRTVFVEFSGSSDVVQVDAENMQAKAGVPVPLVDVLLRRDSADYRFRQTVLRDSGEQRDTDWRTSDAGILVVPVV